MHAKLKVSEVAFFLPATQEKEPTLLQLHFLKSTQSVDIWLHAPLYLLTNKGHNPTLKQELPSRQAKSALPDSSIHHLYSF
jgi:hypothetical protein